MPPVRVTEEISPKKIIRKDGKFIVDFGVNLAGVIRIRMSRPRGTELVVRYGESLDDQGNLNMRMACYIKTGLFQTDKYIFIGQGVEEWSPRFVYHGFRYAEISGTNSLTESEVKALFMHTDFRRIGHFSCDNELFNKIFEIGDRSFRSNYHSIPTDCPHREKNGWTGDAQLSCEQAVKNYDMLSTYRKWIADFADAQRPSGQLPGIIPTAGWGYNWGSGPAWDVALFEIPYQCYIHYGDTGILKDAYPTAKRYHEYMRSRARGNLVLYGLGDWCSPNIEGFKVCDNRLSDSVYYFYMTKIIALMAEVSGEKDEAEDFRALAEEIRNALCDTYIDRDGRIDGGNITAHSLMLYYGVIKDEDQKRLAAKVLNEAVTEAGYKMMVGILGAKTVLNALSDNGYFDTAVKVLENTEYPSYGYWIKNGATTMHEDWESSFSLNHHMFSDVLAWMYKNLAGIKPLTPGFKDFCVSPKFTDAVNTVKASYLTLQGKLAVEYERNGRSVKLRLEVPEGTQCYLELPKTPSQVLQAGTYEKVFDLTDEN